LSYPGLVGIIALSFMLVFAGSTAWSQENSTPPKKEEPATPEQAGRIFDIKVPKGFEPDPPEEPGIFRWKKEGAEILVVAGELYWDSGQELFRRLLKAAEDNAGPENVKKLNIKGARAFSYTEKAPGEPDRLRSVRMIVITDKNIINVDFSAPEKDFKSLAAEFESSKKSFKLKAAKQ
jgi:hypothetical protein